MGLFDGFRRKRKLPVYSGGDGGSIETAVVIRAASSLIGVPAEYEYVIRRHGQKDVGWTLDSQMVMEQQGRYYDVLNVKLSNGEARTYYFDITEFYGKF